MYRVTKRTLSVLIASEFRFFFLSLVSERQEQTKKLPAIATSSHIVSTTTTKQKEETRKDLIHHK